MKKIEEIKKKRADVPRIYASPQQGLNEEQVAERAAAGYANVSAEAPAKTVGQIIASNVFTYFNIVFFALALCIIAVGSFRDLTFMPVVIANMAIGTVQELRAKRTLEKLTILSAPKAEAVRGGRHVTVPIEELVRDDIVVLSSGNQICADAVVISGEIQVNEALVTGESDEIEKKTGDALLSGSFVVSGKCFARLEQVGEDSFVSKLTIEAKKSKRQQHSEMMRSLTRLVQVIGILIIPIGAMLFYNQYKVLNIGLRDSVVSTVGALVGMIPEGLYLLTTVALAVSVIRLAQQKTLVHELGCIETLARVDVLCVDKTGTITEEKMLVDDVVLMCEDRFERSDIDLIMHDYIGNVSDDNETMHAIKAYFGGRAQQRAKKVMPFSSSTKFSGVYFDDGDAYVLGAPESILKERYEEFKDVIEQYSGSGYRVVMLGLYDGDFRNAVLPEEVMPLALILISNKVRENVQETFGFFKEQGVAIKVISGDNPVTVSQIACKAGVENGDKYVDATTLVTDEQIRKAVDKYAVFGRVTPEQKRRLVQALKAEGHTVAMTGDGVNDILALKEADCSIAMASGSDVACQVSHLVLLNSDFASMPSVVMEGRRVINNIERAAALFLVKNIFSFTLSLLSLLFAFQYPLSSSQLSLVSTLTIGVPSFFLALEPNKEIVKGHFLKNVLFRAFPAGLTNILLVMGIVLFGMTFPTITTEQLSTVSALILATVGMIMLYRVCTPFNLQRRIIWFGMLVAIMFACLLLPDLFAISPLRADGWLIFIVFVLLARPTMNSILNAMDFISEKIAQFRESRDLKVR